MIFIRSAWDADTCYKNLIKIFWYPMMKEEMADTFEVIVRPVLENKWLSCWDKSLRSEAMVERLWSSPDSVWKVLLAAKTKNVLLYHRLFLIRKGLSSRPKGAAVWGIYPTSRLQEHLWLCPEAPNCISNIRYINIQKTSMTTARYRL